MTETCAQFHKFELLNSSQKGVNKWAENVISERSFSDTNQSERRNKPIAWGYSHDKTGRVN